MKRGIFQIVLSPHPLPQGLHFNTNIDSLTVVKLEVDEDLPSNQYKKNKAGKLEMVDVVPSSDIFSLDMKEISQSMYRSLRNEITVRIQMKNTSWYWHLKASVSDAEHEAISNTNGAPLFPPKRSTYSCIRMNGNEVFRFACRCVPQTIQASLDDAGLSSSNIDWFLLHQVTFREAESAKKACEDPSPVINGRKSNCNLASVGARRTPKSSPPATPTPVIVPPRQAVAVRSGPPVPVQQQWYYATRAGTGHPSPIAGQQQYHGVVPYYPPPAYGLDVVIRCFSKKNVEEISSAIEQEAKKCSDKWITVAIESLKKAGPTGLKTTLRAVEPSSFQERTQQ